MLGPLVPWTPGGTELHIRANASPARLAGPRCHLPAIPNTPNCDEVDQRGYLRAGGDLETDIAGRSRSPRLGSTARRMSLAPGAQASARGPSVGDLGDRLHATTAARADQHVDLERAPYQAQLAPGARRAPRSSD